MLTNSRVDKLLMAKFYALLILLFFIQNSLATDCTTWPPNLKPIGGCCRLPSEFDYRFSGKCYNNCKNSSSEAINDCAVECYVRLSALMNGTIANKNIVKKIFVDNFMWYENPWKIVVYAAVNNCTFNTTGTLHQNLLHFYNCVNENLAENCINFYGMSECDDTIEHFLKCRNKQYKCFFNTITPEYMSCCKMPLYFAEEFNGKFRLDCQKKEFHTHKKFECAYNQTIAENESKNEGTFDFAIVKKMLIESSNNSEVWTKTIEKAMETCENSVKGKFMRVFIKKSEFFKEL